MRPERVMLRFVQQAAERPGGSEPHYVELRELCGHDEIELDGVNTAAALRLLGRLMGDAPEINTSDRNPNVRKLCASDRDALFAALHRQRWGDRIVSTLSCQGCSREFDLSFNLSTLQRSIYGDAKQASLKLTSEQHLTPPLAEQELAAADYGVAEGVVFLASWVAGNADIDSGGMTSETLSRLSDRLDAVAPLLDVDLKAICPECGHEQIARFDIQTFVMQRLLGEREQLLQDLHCMALNYRWSLSELLSLPTSTRRAMAERLV
ncbi:hypothetical protein [Desulfocastanea catecholica]